MFFESLIHTPRDSICVIHVSISFCLCYFQFKCYFKCLCLSLFVSLVLYPLRFSTPSIRVCKWLFSSFTFLPCAIFTVDLVMLLLCNVCRKMAKRARHRCTNFSWKTLHRIVYSICLTVFQGSILLIAPVTGLILGKFNPLFRSGCKRAIHHLQLSIATACVEFNDERRGEEQRFFLFHLLP